MGAECGSSGGEPPCSGVFDDFEDEEIDAAWSEYGDEGVTAPMMVESDGELRWFFSPDVVGQRGIWRTLDAPAARVRVHVTELTDLEAGEAQSAVLLREDGGVDDIVLVFSSGRVDVRQGTAAVGESLVFDWVEARFEGDQVVISSSADGLSFTEIVSIAGDHGNGLQSVWLYGQTWTEAPSAASASFGSIEVCAAR